MRSIQTFALTAVALGALASSASAAYVTNQRFQFLNPTLNTTTSDNAIFETDLQQNQGYIHNILGTPATSTSSIDLVVDSFDASGNNVKHDTSGSGAIFFLQGGTQPNGTKYKAPTTFTTSGYATNDYLDGNITGGTAAGTGAGLLTFVKSGTILLQISFDASQFSSSLFTPSSVHYLGGTLLNDNIKASTNGNVQFGLTAASDDSSYKSSGFNSTASVPAPVPEPSTIAALGLGGLALLRRRRRA